MKKTLRFIALCVAFIMVGCGFAPKGKGPLFSLIPPPPEKARVYHYRIERTFGNGAYYKLYTNNEYSAIIGNGGYYEQVLDPGTYEYSSLWQARGFPLLILAMESSTAKKKHQLTLTVEPNKSYYLRWNVSESYEVEEVNEEVALKELKNLKKFEDVVPKPELRPLQNQKMNFQVQKQEIKE